MRSAEPQGQGEMKRVGGAQSRRRMPTQVAGATIVRVGRHDQRLEVGCYCLDLCDRGCLRCGIDFAAPYLYGQRAVALDQGPRRQNASRNSAATNWCSEFLSCQGEDVPRDIEIGEPMTPFYATIVS